MAPAVTLLTDFGWADTYVGQLKGALLRTFPEVQWVDLCHTVPPQDVRAGAFLLWSAVEIFPAGTVHLAVVDPGVGSSRRAVAARSARGDLFVGPDNGLLCPALDRLGGVAAAVELRERSYWGEGPTSGTFHGRDIFAPVAAHLARGTPLEQLGPKVQVLERPFWLPAPHIEGNTLVGEILHVDLYGNLITNLPSHLLPASFEVVVGDDRIPGAPHAHYQSVAVGELLAVVGSAGLLEISVRDGSAASLTGARRGTEIQIHQE